MEKLYPAIIALVVSCAAFADYGPYKATFISAYDGDTMTLLLTLSPGLYRETKVRLAAVDTPEIQAQCPEEKDLAITARDLTRSALASATELRVTIHGIDRYGRWLATVTIDGTSLAATLLDRGLARPWSGRREGWC